jgi:sugar phosphate isomerase/epimerase
MKLSLITDEVSQDLDTALEFGLDLGMRWFALRSVWGKNVLNLDDAEVEAIVRRMRARKVGVSALLSPLLKCYLTGDETTDDPTGHFVGFSRSLDTHIRSFARASWLAARFEARLVRVFSFLKQDTLHFSKALPTISYGLERSRSAITTTICLENEHTCYVDTFPALQRFLRQRSEGNGGLRLAIDPCNHLCVTGVDGFEQLQAASELLMAASDVHVKDRDGAGRYVTVGEGVLPWPLFMDELRRSGYQGFVTLECHLAGDIPGVETSLRRAAAWLE